MKPFYFWSILLLPGMGFVGPSHAAEPVDFTRDVKPIFEFDCVRCHKEGHAKGKLRLDDRAAALKGGEDGAAIVPGNPAKSLLYKRIMLSADDDDLMPPSNKGGPLKPEEKEILRRWIAEGAHWPKGITLLARKKTAAPVKNPSGLLGRLHQEVVANQKVSQESQMKPYTDSIVGTGVTFDMVPIPSGAYEMGSPASEPGHKPDEGPVHRVKISAFWMGKCEVTWNEFELFMYPDQEKRLRAMHGGPAKTDALADALARPTQPYVEMSFGMGKDGYPAISMTQHAASQYCKWLTAKTGHFYRLPTEAEWEYACRAGTTTAYFFGNDPSKLGDYAWYSANSNWKYQKVGTKKPNPWGLYDIIGNVSEWTLDQYDPHYYAKFKGITAQDPWNRPTHLYPRSVRGGSWEDDPPALRSAARLPSDPSWKQQDPQLPKSIWYHTDAQFLGFRIVRPLKVPSTKQMGEYWAPGVDQD